MEVHAGEQQVSRRRPLRLRRATGVGPTTLSPSRHRFTARNTIRRKLRGGSAFVAADRCFQKVFFGRGASSRVLLISSDSFYARTTCHFSTKKRAQKAAHIGPYPPRWSFSLHVGAPCRAACGRVSCLLFRYIIICGGGCGRVARTAKYNRYIECVPNQIHNSLHMARTGQQPRRRSQSTDASNRALAQIFCEFLIFSIPFSIQ